MPSKFAPLQMDFQTTILSRFDMMFLVKAQIVIQLHFPPLKGILTDG
jgi:hypothetical protein